MWQLGAKIMRHALYTNVLAVSGNYSAPCVSTDINNQFGVQKLRTQHSGIGNPEIELISDYVGDIDPSGGMFWKLPFGEPITSPSPANLYAKHGCP